MDTVEDIVRSYSNRVKDGRTLRDVFRHMNTEIKELDDELLLDACGQPPGEDGIVGEALDAISCLYDIIYLHRPDITKAELAAIMTRKMEKWVQKYG